MLSQPEDRNKMWSRTWLEKKNAFILPLWHKIFKNPNYRKVEIRRYLNKDSSFFRPKLCKMLAHLMSVPRKVKMGLQRYLSSKVSSNRSSCIGFRRSFSSNESGTFGPTRVDRKTKTKRRFSNLDLDSFFIHFFVKINRTKNEITRRNEQRRIFLQNFRMMITNDQ